ncbi:hypothetical protein PM082_019887 [Marasmius tenuissimus]|nr:hypothetical protein PM082_019887 [Marasmius tenuissimus]
MRSLEHKFMKQEVTRPPGELHQTLFLEATVFFDQGANLHPQQFRRFWITVDRVNYACSMKTVPFIWFRVMIARSFGKSE